MTAIAESVLDEIRERIDLVDLVGEHTTLRKAGREYIGLCCFHDERSPSLAVNAEKGVFLCRGGCGASGDAFDFVRQLENVDFAGAAERLANRLGIDSDQRSRVAVAPIKPREVTVEQLLRTRVPDPAWLAWRECGGCYADAPRIRTSRKQDAIGDARSWIVFRARAAWRTGDLLTLGRLLEALGGEWPEGHRGQWLWLEVETLARDAWWAGDVERLARAIDALDELDRTVAR